MHRLDLPGQGIDSFEGLVNISDLNFVFIDVSRNGLKNFEGFGTHNCLMEMDLRSNDIDSFLGLTRQSALKAVHMSGNPVADHPLYRIMLLQTVGYSLHMIDYREVTPTEVSLARRLGPKAALAVSCGWLLDLIPRSPLEYAEIIERRRVEHRKTRRHRPALCPLDTVVRQLTDCVVTGQRQIETTGVVSAQETGPTPTEALACVLEFDDAISLKTNLHSEESEVMGVLRFEGPRIVFLDFLRQRKLVEMDIRRTSLTVSKNVLVFSYAYGLEVWVKCASLEVLEAVKSAFTIRKEVDHRRLWGDVKTAKLLEEDKRSRRSSASAAVLQVRHPSQDSVAPVSSAPPSTRGGSETTSVKDAFPTCGYMENGASPRSARSHDDETSFAAPVIEKDAAVVLRSSHSSASSTSVARRSVNSGRSTRTAPKTDRASDTVKPSSSQVAAPNAASSSGLTAAVGVKSPSASFPSPTAAPQDDGGVATPPRGVAEANENTNKFKEFMIDSD